jgi:Sugar efflux transporter for intercellular exchange
VTLLGLYTLFCFVRWVAIIYIYISYPASAAPLDYTAPVQDLRRALQEGTLGCLNPLPWSIMTGNCLGWSAYGYCTKDPFVLASNLPGLILSIWLNSGAAKLQYYDSLRQQHVQHQQNDEEDEEERTSHRSRNQEMIITVPQERMLLRILILWSCILVWAGWIQHSFSQASIVGICVNVNLGKDSTLNFLYTISLSSSNKNCYTRFAQIAALSILSH